MNFREGDSLSFPRHHHGRIKYFIIPKCWVECSALDRLLQIGSESQYPSVGSDKLVVVRVEFPGKNRAFSDLIDIDCLLSFR